MKQYAIVKGHHNGQFVCAIEFAFNPPVCVAAAPKVRDLFINKGLDKCKNIAEKMGFEFNLMGNYYD